MSLFDMSGTVTAPSLKVYCDLLTLAVGEARIPRFVERTNLDDGSVTGGFTINTPTGTLTICCPAKDTCKECGK